MKACTTTLNHKQQAQTGTGSGLALAAAGSAREVLAVLAALVAVTVVVLAAVWVSGREMTDIVSAATWGIGLAFLGLAVDNREPAASLQLLSGLLLLLLAWLQHSVSPDFMVASGFVVAAWVAGGLYRCLR